MSNDSLNADSVSQLAAQADAIGRLAQDSGGFAAAVAAFQSRNPDAFRWVLDRLNLVSNCELICEWVRIKNCVLRCVELCGPLAETSTVPDLRQFAQVVVQLASNDKLLRRVVDAVSCGNADEYRAAVAELELGPFCHLVCRWVCAVIYRRVCEIVCSPERVPVADAVSEISAAGKTMARLIADEKAFDSVAKAAAVLDCELASSAIEQAGFAEECETICWVICGWRCSLICRELCLRPSPVLTGAYAIEEARNFALAARPLAGQPRALRDLVAAVLNRDAESYGSIIARLGARALLRAGVRLGMRRHLRRVLHLRVPESGAAALVHDGGIFRHLHGYRRRIREDQQGFAVREPGLPWWPEFRVLRVPATGRVLSVHLAGLQWRPDEVSVPL